MWKKFFVGIGLVVITMGFVVPPVFAQSVSNECTCFCATPKGAIKTSDTKIKPEACTEACEAKKQKVAVCANSLAQYPANNSSCFPLDVCNAEGGKFSDPYRQPPECPETWGYCFHDIEAAEVQLNVPIGAVTSVKDLGVYMSVAYKWMLGATILFSTVMIMIGGLQWSLGAVSSSQIQKAKDRIKNGIIGLILLFAVVLIAETVNPELLTLKPPRISMVKEKNSPGMKTCEEFNTEGYTLSLESGVCGNSAEIIGAPDGKAFIDGITCNYTFCSNEGNEKCLQLPPSPTNPNRAACTWCGNIIPRNSYGVKPSTQVCESLSMSGKDLTWITSDDRKFFEVCFYTHDPNMLYNAEDNTRAITTFGIDVIIGEKGPTDLITGACAEIEIQCPYKDFTNEDMDECSDYDQLDVKNQIEGADDLEDMFVNGPWTGKYTLQNICKDDPCKVGKDKGGCWYSGDYFKGSTVPGPGGRIPIDPDDCLNYEDYQKKSKLSTE